jgi:hypothetical protein
VAAQRVLEKPQGSAQCSVHKSLKRALLRLSTLMECSRLSRWTFIGLPPLITHHSRRRRAAMSSSRLRSEF